MVRDGGSDGVGRTILHLDIDAFFASIEQLKNPYLRGKPVIVGAGVIASCSYEARRYGCRAGMSLRQALRLCPHAIILEGNQHTYACFTEAIWEIARRWLPEMETYLDEAYGDLAGTEKLFGHPRRVGEELKREILERVGLRVTVGIGANRMVAKMAGKSAKPDGLAFVPWGEEEAFVADRPVGDLPGVGPATEAMLREMNLLKVRDLRALSREVFKAMLGKNGLHLYERCRGRDTRPVHEREIPTTISRETSVHRPTGDAAEIRAFLQYLAERALRTIRKLGLVTRAVRVRVRYEDARGEEAGQTLDRATDVDEEVLPVIWKCLDRVFTRRVNLTHMGVVFSKFAVADPQAELFETVRDARLSRLHAAVDAIRDRFGHSAVTAGASIALLGKIHQDGYGYVLRCPSLTK
ncbi:MAG: DNA polymerase IV [Planctomycetes bacterium]|nr:DNA polymerase IV [Planctomycetota bacterium]